MAGEAARVAASEVGSERVSIARVDGNAARWLAQTRGRANDQGKAPRVAASERGQQTSFNGANGMSDIEGSEPDRH
jgi:hypothetical protein